MNLNRLRQPSGGWARAALFFGSVFLTGMAIAFVATGPQAAAQQGATSPPAASAASSTPTPTPDLKDREIEILKAQLAATQKAKLQDHITRIVDETQLQVAAIHHWTVHRVVEYAPLTPKILDQMFSDSVDDQYPEVALDQWMWFYRLFNAMPEGYDIKTGMRKLLGEQVAGLYDPKSGKLFVSESFNIDGGMGRMILAHELTHSFQDQDYDLRKIGIDASGDDDRALAASSIAEGDATLAMGEYMAREGKLLSLLLDVPHMLSMDQEEIEKAPAIIQESMLFPYLQGVEFFQILGGRTRTNPRGEALPGESAWRNDIFAHPPITTSQILHPEQYLADKRPAEIPLFKTPNPALGSTNVVGEAQIGELLDCALAKPKGIGSGGGAFNLSLMGGMPALSDRAANAAEGWNGDRIMIEDNQDHTERSLHWTTRWDTPRDAREFRDAMTDAFKAKFKTGIKWSDQGENETDAKGKAASLKIAQPEPASVEIEGTFPIPPKPKAK